MTHLIWLASYPKSGNTWVRTFLAHYENPSSGIANLPSLAKYKIASSRELFDYIAGIEASNLTEPELQGYRSRVFEYLQPTSPFPIFKIHDAFLQKNHQPIIPIASTRLVIYLVRNPLDVVISFAHHRGEAIEKTISFMNNPNATIGVTKAGVNAQFQQYLGTWSEHARGWTEQSLLPVHVIRYEDMLLNPGDSFKIILKLCGLDFNAEQFEKALHLSSFPELRRMEEEHGFDERPIQASAPFFRQGTAGQWMNVLSEEQKNGLIQRHKDMMEKFEYLPLQANADSPTP